MQEALATIVSSQWSYLSLLRHMSRFISECSRLLAPARRVLRALGSFSVASRYATSINRVAELLPDVSGKTVVDGGAAPTLAIWKRGRRT